MRTQTALHYKVIDTKPQMRRLELWQYFLSKQNSSKMDSQMSAEATNYLISVALLLFATLIGYGVIPVQVKPGKVENFGYWPNMNSSFFK